MNGWRGWGREEEDRADPTRLKLAFALGAFLGLLVLSWMHFARAGEERVSSSGFSEGVAGFGSGPALRDPRVQTGLSFVSRDDAPAPSSVRVEAAPGASAAASLAQAPANTAAAPAAAATATPASAAPVDPKELAAAGVPTDAAGLSRLGAQRGLLSEAVARLLDHPRILKAVLDNKLVVDALMSRDTSKRNCSDPAALQSILSTPGSGPVARLMPVVADALARPEAAAAFAGSELGSRLMSCPSVQGLSHDPAGLMAIATANPQALSIVSDPRVAQALASSAQGGALLGGVQTTLNPGAGGR